METAEISAHDYEALFRQGSHVYNTVAFNSLNATKVVGLHHLVFRSSRIKAGIILGERPDGVLASGFSAPFGGFDFPREQEAATVIEIVAALRRWLGGRRAIITMPPEFYSPSMNAKTRHALAAAGATCLTLVNHHVDLTGIREHGYEAMLDSKARNKLGIARRAPFTFGRCDAAEAYAVIEANRRRRGYPLAMTLEQVCDTAPIAGTEFYVLKLDGIPMAAAQVNNVAPGIRQLIYWGDTDSEPGLHPMNRLAAELFAEYARRGDTRIIDLGPSGDFESLSPGLASFKESVGATASLKHRFTL